MAHEVEPELRGFQYIRTRENKERTGSFRVEAYLDGNQLCSCKQSKNILLIKFDLRGFCRSIVDRGQAHGVRIPHGSVKVIA